MKHMARIMAKSRNDINRMRPSTIGTISSISQEDGAVNTETYSGSELRDVPVVSPYGISSMPVDNISAQVLCNNGQNSIVGVINPNRPKPTIGGVILYDKDGNTIALNDGKIEIKHKSGSTITFTDDGDINIHASRNVNVTAGGMVNV